MERQKEQIEEQLDLIATKDARLWSLERELQTLTQQHCTELQEREAHTQELQLQLRQRHHAELQEQVQQHEAHTQELQCRLLESEELLHEFEGTLERLRLQLYDREHNLWKAQHDLHHIREELKCKDRQLRVKDERIKTLLQQQERQKHPASPLSTQSKLKHASFSLAYKISCSGLETATTSHPVEFTIEVVDGYGRPCASDRKMSAVLKSQVDGSMLEAKVVRVTQSQYQVTYKPQSRGFCDLHVMANGADIHGSPFKVFVRHPPSLLSRPVRVLENIALPWGIALNSYGDILVTENGADRVAVIDGFGKTVRTIGSGQLRNPTGLAVDSSDNVYVASEHSLLKFTQSGELVKTVGMRGNKYGEFDCPMGVCIHHEQVYLCDLLNERVQVFDLNLRFLRSFTITDTLGSQITDLAFDSVGKIYAVNRHCNKVLILDPVTLKYEPDFGQRGENLSNPTGIHIAEYVYVSDCSNHRIVVYSLSGECVACFGREGQAPGSLKQPHSITTDANGFIYVCDFGNGRVQVF